MTKEKNIYCRINTIGYLKELGVRGPIKTITLPESKLIELVENGRDVVVLTPAFPDLVKKLQEIRKAKKVEMVKEFKSTDELVSPKFDDVQKTLNTINNLSPKHVDDVQLALQKIKGENVNTDNVNNEYSDQLGIINKDNNYSKKHHKDKKKQYNTFNNEGNVISDNTLTELLEGASKVADELDKSISDGSAVESNS